jgi:hypothetical protein
MAHIREPENTQLLDRSTSFVKDNLSIGRIAAGISPAGIIFPYPPDLGF